MSIKRAEAEFNPPEFNPVFVAIQLQKMMLVGTFHILLQRQLKQCVVGKEGWTVGLCATEAGSMPFVTSPQVAHFLLGGRVTSYCWIYLKILSFKLETILPTGHLMVISCFLFPEVKPT